VIPLLLAHPDIEVNLKDIYGWAPFDYACNGNTSCVREMLKDSRVELGLVDELAAEMFALVVFVSDGLLQIKDTDYHTCSEVLLHCQKTSSGTANGAVPHRDGITQGDHPRQRERGGLQGPGKESHAFPLHHLALILDVIVKTLEKTKDLS